MDKSPEAFRTISEVAEALGVPPHVLRFWESRFAQVKPVKRGGGRRYYRPEDVRLLRGIRGLLYDDGMTIKGVQKILRERGIRHVIDLGTTADGQEIAVPVAAAAPRPPKAARPKPQPKAEPVAAPQAPARMPQPDLFEARSAGGAQVAELDAPSSAGRAVVRDRAALRGLLAELEALRAEMVAGPKR
jgi:DNA-binding transcriptional MerR regulator